MRPESSKSTGPTCGEFATCGSSRGFPPSMSSAEDSHAKTLATLEASGVSMVPGADCGLNLSESFAWFDQESSSWKTSQRCLFEVWELFWETWPATGLMQSGKCYLRVPSAPHTCDDECSLWPTPTASMDGRGFGIPLHDRTGRYKQSTVRRVQELVGKHGWRIHPNFTEALMGFPLDATEIAVLETQSAPKSPSGLDTE